MISNRFQNLELAIFNSSETEKSEIRTKDDLVLKDPKVFVCRPLSASLS